MYKNMNDYELLYLIADNNELAYNSMYDKYNSMVKIEANKFARRIKYLGISYDDIYQAGLYGLEIAIESFNENEEVTFYTYASTIIKREIATFLRSCMRFKHSILSDSVSLDLEIGEDSNLQDFIKYDYNTIDDYYNNERNRNFLELKYDLPLPQSLIYELKFNNFSNKEISILLDMDYKAVDNSITSIKNKFRKMKNRIEVYF